MREVRSGVSHRGERGLKSEAGGSREWKKSGIVRRKKIGRAVGLDFLRHPDLRASILLPLRTLYLAPRRLTAILQNI
jgi:hypothetical protein